MGAFEKETRTRATAVALLAAAVLGGCGPDAGSDAPSTSAVAARGARAVAADVRPSEYGVQISARVGYPDRRRVTGARLLVGERSVDATLFPLDGTDPDRPPSSVELGPGDQVLLEAWLLLPCPVDDEPAVFEVVSRAGGAVRTDHLVLADRSAFRDGVDAWCDRPVTMNVTGSSEDPSGRYEIVVQVSNPGPGAVEVTSDAIDDGESSWEAARVTVPAGSIETLRIPGAGPSLCEATPPWQSGAVRADGEVLRPAIEEWC